MKLYRQFEYAKNKGVSRPYISKLIKGKKLKIKIAFGIKCIKDCPENDAIFIGIKRNNRAFSN